MNQIGIISTNNKIIRCLNMNYRKILFYSNLVYLFIQQFKEFYCLQELRKIYFSLRAYKKWDNASRSTEISQLARELLNECAPVWVSCSSSLYNTCVVCIHERTRSILLWYLYWSPSARTNSCAHLCQTLCRHVKAPWNANICREHN